ncbi:hydantoinase/oxoprolinase family protein [Streptomyces sp. NPDC057257]|uniref:hydantoinase/oxoprolinase family protein n=1 Tax=Streptomyces sp. NPDC057257 TaxID=3346071 RepID=UPI00362DE540
MDPDRFHVGTDVGGTFTDLWAIAGDGRQTVVKAPSTPDIVTGILDAVGLAAQAFGQDVPDFCARIDRFGHGTTAGLNALLTGNAAPTAVITTEGFRDTLEIGRLKRQVAGLTDLEVGDYLNRGRWAPVVPRTSVFEVRERIDRTGEVVVPLDPASVADVLESVEASGASAVAICTLWSVANPVHELALREAVAQRFPELFVSLSHEVAPSVGEYARMSTTATNAALGPVMGTYLATLDAALREQGLSVPVRVMTGGGGVVPADEVGREPVGALLSGPAAGVITGQILGRRMGIDRLLTIDVGGTSFDVGVVVDGSPLMRGEVIVGGADIRRPAIDVGTIGAGGGSIARVQDGSLSVGPQSAGATPGPVCYGRGGTQATATDADLVLGVLDETGFAGGTMRLSRSAAEAAIAEQIAAPLGLSTVEAAWGVRQILDSKMADLLRTVTIERGHDPREFVMFAGGGQGPSHAWALCRELGIRSFVVTATATGQSAYGTGTSDPRVTAQRPCYVRIPPAHTVSEDDVARLEAEFAEAGEAAVRRMGPTVGEPTTERIVSLRYRGQAHHLDVPLPEPQLDAACVDKLLERFEAQYEALFGAGAAFREAGFEILSVRVMLTARLTAGARPTPSDPLVAAGTRTVVFDDPGQPCECPVWTTAFPAPWQHIEGPCLVVYPGQTLVVPPGATGRTDELGNIVVTFPEESS